MKRRELLLGAAAVMLGASPTVPVIEQIRRKFPRLRHAEIATFACGTRAVAIYDGKGTFINELIETSEMDAARELSAWAEKRGVMSHVWVPKSARREARV